MAIEQIHLTTWCETPTGIQEVSADHLLEKQQEIHLLWLTNYDEHSVEV